MTNHTLTKDEKRDLGMASIFIGAMLGAIVAFTVFGACMIFLSFGQAFGIAVVSFWPALIIIARWNVRLYLDRKKKEAETAEQATVT